MLPTHPLLNATAPAGPHLPVALLRQYAAGTLAPAAQHRVEAHTLACTRCSDILEGLLQSSPMTTDQALVQLQQRLRIRVQQQAAPARLAPRQPRWLAPQLAAAAALLLGLVAGGWWTWQQRHPTPSGAPERVTTTMSLPPPTGQDSNSFARMAAQGRAATPVRMRVDATPAGPVTAPAPAGGYSAWREKLRREAAKFVPKAPARRLSGTVQLRLTIGADGKIQGIKILQSLRADYDDEAQRLVRKGPNWIPGTSKEQQATQLVDVAVPFQ
jgi:TonB family protein